MSSRFLLDTSVFIWMAGPAERLNRKAEALLSIRSQELYLSAASSWEMTIKNSLGKLDLPQKPAQYVPRCLIEFGIQSLAVTHEHAFATADLPNHHDDPFDRLLIAQARSEDMVLLTADKVFKRYDVEVFWCGR
jgi:PIN domain nuclease of toxin-antitoxin system